MAEHFNILLSLPLDLISSVLLKWLDLSSLPRVDSAYCNHKQRFALLAAFSSKQFIVSNSGSAGSNKQIYWNWITVRCIRMEELIAFEDQTSLLADYTHMFGNAVRQITLNTTGLKENVSALKLNVAFTLRACTNLHTLKLECTALSCVVFESISKCSSLRVLKIKCAELWGRGASESLHELEIYHKLNITTLQVSAGSLTTSRIFNMVSPLSLKVLEIRHFITPHLVDLLTLCVNLDALSINNENQTLSDENFMLILSKCPQIHHLEINCGASSAACASFIAQTLTQLKTICIYNFQFCDELLVQLAEHHTDTLEGLYIMDAFDMSGDSLNAVLQKCTKLQTLHIYRLSSMDFDPTLLCNLTTLVLQVDADTEQFLTTVAPHCTKVAYFGLANTFMEPQDISLTLRNKNFFPALRVLDIFDQVGGPELRRWLTAQRSNLTFRQSQNVKWYKFYDVARAMDMNN